MTEPYTCCNYNTHEIHDKNGVTDFPLKCRFSLNMMFVFVAAWIALLIRHNKCILRKVKRIRNNLSCEFDEIHPEMYSDLMYLNLTLGPNTVHEIYTWRSYNESAEFRFS